jgi:23S rRNA pseudouridine2604 synthase
MCSALGYRAQRLQRVRIINLELGRLGSGEWRELTAAEVKDLLPRRPADVSH